MSHSPTNQKQDTAAFNPLNTSPSVNTAASNDYFHLLQFANGSPDASRSSVGPLSVPTTAPGFEEVVLERGTHLAFPRAAGAIKPDLGNRPDIDEIKVNGDKITLSEPIKCHRTEEGTLVLQQTSKGTVGTAEIFFPGDSRSIRFSGFSVKIEGGTAVHEAEAPTQLAA